MQITQSNFEDCIQKVVEDQLNNKIDNNTIVLSKILSSQLKNAYKNPFLYQANEYIKSNNQENVINHNTNKLESKFPKNIRNNNDEPNIKNINSKILPKKSSKTNSDELKSNHSIKDTQYSIMSDDKNSTRKTKLIQEELIEEENESVTTQSLQNQNTDSNNLNNPINYTDHQSDIIDHIVESDNDVKPKVEMKSFKLDNESISNKNEDFKINSQITIDIENDSKEQQDHSHHTQDSLNFNLSSEMQSLSQLNKNVQNISTKNKNSNKKNLKDVEVEQNIKNKKYNSQTEKMNDNDQEQTDNIKDDQEFNVNSKGIFNNYTDKKAIKKNIISKQPNNDKNQSKKSKKIVSVIKNDILINESESTNQEDDQIIPSKFNDLSNDGKKQSCDMNDSNTVFSDSSNKLNLKNQIKDQDYIFYDFVDEYEKRKLECKSQLIYSNIPLMVEHELCQMTNLNKLSMPLFCTRNDNSMQLEFEIAGLTLKKSYLVKESQTNNLTIKKIIYDVLKFFRKLKIKDIYQEKHYIRFKSMYIELVKV